MSPSLTPPRKGHRLWIPLTIAVLALGGFAIVGLRPELERNFRSWILSGIALLFLLLMILWFVLLSRFGWKSRLLGLAAVALLVLTLRLSLRVDGAVNASGLPRLVWKWSNPAPRHFAPASTGRSSNATPARLHTDLPDVPQFFGPHRDGTVRGAALARDWSTHPPRELWRQPIGLGWSSFSIAKGCAFTEEQRGDDELVTSYDVLTGRLLWAHTNHVRFTQWQGGDGPRATPTVDHGHVFAYGGTGILDCLDAADGHRLWSHDVLAENHLPNLTWGVSSSPLVTDKLVVVSGGFLNVPSLVAYHRDTGEPAWQAGDDKASYASPVLAKLAGREVILSVNAASLTAHDPATGRVVLQQDWATDKWPKASQPVVLGNDRVFISAGYGVGCEMLKITAGADGSLGAELLWKNLMMKTQFNSAAARDGSLYGLDDGLLACVDADSGRRRWKDGRYGSGQSLLVDDLILIQTETGPVVLAEASPDGFKELGSFPALSSKTWNHPVLSGHYLLVRNDREAACFELPGTGPVPGGK